MEQIELRIYLKAARSLLNAVVPLIEFGFRVATFLCPPYRRRVDEQRAQFEEMFSGSARWIWIVFSPFSNLSF